MNLIVIDEQVEIKLQNIKNESFVSSVKLRNGQWITNVMIVDRETKINEYTINEIEYNKNQDENGPFFSPPKSLSENLNDFLFENLLNQNSITEIKLFKNILNEEFYEKLGEYSQDYLFDGEYFYDPYWIFSLQFKNDEIINCYLEDKKGPFDIRHRNCSLPNNYLIQDVKNIYKNKIYKNGTFIECNYVTDDLFTNDIVDLNTKFTCLIVEEYSKFLNIENRTHLKDYNSDDLPF